MLASIENSIHWDEGMGFYCELGFSSVFLNSNDKAEVQHY